MDRLEAIKAMLEGKRITHSKYHQNSYVTFTGGGFFFHDSDRGSELVRAALVHSAGYFIVKEKVVKKKYWLWSHKENGHISGRFYDEDGNDAYGDKIHVASWNKTNCFVEIEAEE